MLSAPAYIAWPQLDRKGVIPVKRLVYDRAHAQYVIEGEPELLVLGLEHGGLGTADSPRWFTWINAYDHLDDDTDIQTPEALIQVLYNEPEYIEVEAEEYPSDPPARALVVKLGRLAPHVGYYPSNLAEGWAAVRKLVQEYMRDIYRENGA